LPLNPNKVNSLGLAYHEARHLEQYYRAIQYEPRVFKNMQINRPLANSAAGRKDSIPEGRRTFAESMNNEIVNRSVMKYKEKDDPIEHDAYVLNQAVINALRRDSKDKKTYREVYKYGDDIAKKGIESKLDKYDCLN
jgi:hypothetical protein